MENIMVKMVLNKDINVRIQSAKTFNEFSKSSVSSRKMEIDKCSQLFKTEIERNKLKKFFIHSN